MEPPGNPGRFIQEGIDAAVTPLSGQHVHALVNNAGFSHLGKYGEREFADEYGMLRVNCHALMALAHAFVRQAREGDALINLSSTTAYVPGPTQPAYCATKAFIASLSESLWYRARARGVYVQGLLPGVTQTEFVGRAGDRGGARRKLIDFASQPPKRVVDASPKALARRRRPTVHT